MEEVNTIQSDRVTIGGTINVEFQTNENWENNCKKIKAKQIYTTK